MLDVAGGTGDISFRALRRFPRAHVTVCDINEEMLRVGEQKAKEDRTVRGGEGYRHIEVAQVIHI